MTTRPSALVAIIILMSLGAGDSHGQTQQEQQQSSAKFPDDSVAFVYCDDLGTWLRNAAVSGLGRAVQASPAVELQEFALRRLQDMPETSAAQKFLEPDQTAFDLLAEIFNGPLECAVFPRSENLQCLISCQINRENVLVRRMLRGFAEEARWGPFHVTKIVDATDFCFTDASSPWTFRLTADRLIAGQDEKLVREWNLDEGLAPPKALRTNRKFLEILHQCGTDHRRRGTLTWYLDLDFWARALVAQSPNVAETKRVAREIGALDLLAMGGNLYFGDERVDMGLDAYLIQGFPRQGINQVFSFGKLTQNDLFSHYVPADVDFFFTSQIDLKAFRNGMRSLNDVLKPQFNNRDVILRGVLVVAPLLALMCFLEESEVDKYTGRFHAYGLIRDETQLRLVDSVTRLDTLPGKAESGLQDFSRTMPGFERLEKRSLDELTYYTPSDRALEQSRQREKELRKMAPDHFPDIEVDRNAIAFGKDFVAAFAQLSTMKQIIAKANAGAPSLAEDSEFRLIAEYVLNDRSPGAFLYLRSAEAFRNLYYLAETRQQEAWRSYLEEFRGSRPPANSGSLQDQYEKHAVGLLDKWSYKDFAKHFGPAGVAIFDTSYGIKIEFRQFKSTDLSLPKEKDK